MPRTTILFGALLFLLGITFFVLTGNAHPTALIPAALGLILCLCGALARTENPGRRKLWMHIAVTVGLLGFLAAAVRSISACIRAHGAPLPHPDAVLEQAIMGLLCLLFTGLCVRSFIAARRDRLA